MQRENVPIKVLCFLPFHEIKNFDWISYDLCVMCYARVCTIPLNLQINTEVNIVRNEHECMMYM